MIRANVLSAWKHLLVIAALVSGALAHAQTPVAASEDPPLRVGRLSQVTGEVSFSPGGSDEWVQARINRPVVTGDQLWADNNGRAELTVDNSTWWLGEYTSVTVSNLDDRIAQFQVQQGTLDFRVRRLPSGQIVEVDTPNLAFTVTRPGHYRITVDPQNNATTVVVRSGAGDVYGENASYALASGQAYRFHGNDLSDSEYLALPQRDAFDRWVAERDRRYERVESARYVSPEVIGYEDLDTYGAWSVQANYGSVWFPRSVQTGWAPYRDGHWAWIDPWGWTWVDDQPWGFAPFHYGRWAYFDRGWGWIPGPRNVRPVYAPALVAFVGGASFSIAVSSGPAIGWFPLGPREVYRPWYSVSRDYFRQVNVSNTVVNQVNITNVYNNYRNNTNVTQVNYVNMRAPNAVTAVPPTVFAQSQNVSRAAVALPAATIARAQVQPVARVAPARAAFVGAAPAANVRPPAATMQRSVVARRAPPPPPVPDSQKLQALERNPGQPLSRQQLQQMRQTAQAPARAVRVVEQPKPAANAAPPARPAGERAAQRREGAGATPPAAAGAPATAPGAPGRAAAPPAGAAPERAPATAAPGAERRGPTAAPEPAAKGPAAARPPQSQATPGAARREPGAAPEPAQTSPGARQIQEERQRAMDNRGQPGGQSRAAPPQAQSPDNRPQPQQRSTETRPQPQERPQPQAQPERSMQQARPQPQERPQPQARPQPQERPQPQARPQPQERPQPQAQQERSMQQARPQPQERPQPQARPQPQERPQPQAQQERSMQQARPQPQERPQPQARPQPQERPQPQARQQPQPQERPQPQARPQPQPQARPQPAPPPEARQQPQQRSQGQQRGKGDDKDKDKDKD